MDGHFKRPLTFSHYASSRSFLPHAAKERLGDSRSAFQVLRWYSRPDWLLASRTDLRVKPEHTTCSNR